MKTAVILFSKDRAMQLDAALRSFFRHCQDPERASVSVLYKATGATSAANYDRLKRDYPQVAFVQETAFKAQLLDLMQPADYLFFTVDDNLFVGRFSIAQIGRLLDTHGDAVGFSLRMGRNTGFDYVRQRPQPLPDFQPVEEGVLRYDWTRSRANFAYPLEVSSSVYRQADILPLLREARFYSPNTLEYSLAIRAKLFRETKPQLLCLETSVAFCIPVNQVQRDFRNPVSRAIHYDVGELDRLFQAGKRIAVARFDGFVPGAAHQEVSFPFTDVG